jgi:hypothetical protein
MARPDDAPMRALPSGSATGNARDKDGLGFRPAGAAAPVGPQPLRHRDPPHERDAYLRLP